MDASSPALSAMPINDDVGRYVLTSLIDQINEEDDRIAVVIDLFWFATSSCVLLIASWLVLSLGQAYYSMMLFPFLMTVVLKNSGIRNWPAWLVICGFMSADKWLLGHWPTTGRALEYLRVDRS